MKPEDIYFKHIGDSYGKTRMITIISAMEEYAKIAVDEYKKARANGKEKECKCLECNQTFKSRKSNYCSPLCYHRTYRRKNRKKVASWQTDYRIRKKESIKFWN